MSQLHNTFDSNQSETLESQIDRLNNRIFEFVNTSVFSASESELLSPYRQGFHKTFEDSDKDILTEENDLNHECLNQVRMKLEDFRSHTMRENELLEYDYDLRSSLGDNFRKSDLEIKEISAEEVFFLYKQAKTLLQDIETASVSNKTLKFAGLTINFNIVGTHLPSKQKILKQLLPDKAESKIKTLETQLIDLKKNLFFPSESFQSFIQETEAQMLNSFKDLCCDHFFTHTKKISSKDLGNKKSWALLQKTYKQLKLDHSKCETISKELQWQNLEASLANNLLHQKFQAVLMKEGELNFRHQELLKLQTDYQQKKEELEQKVKETTENQERLEREKRKLDRMKNLIKSQMQEINKSESSIETKRPLSASRLTENSPTLRRIRNHSRNTVVESEIQETQSEISKLEKSLNTSGEQINDIRLSKLYTKLSNLKTQKALEMNSATSDSMQIVLNSSKESVRKAGLRESSPRPEPSKPPMYRKTKANEVKVDKGLVSREERLMEKEIEMQQREKEICNRWMKVPGSEQAAGQIQNEILRLRGLQKEYDLKIERIRGEDIGARKGDVSLGGSEEESVFLHKRIQKLNDIYSMIEEML